MQFLEMWSERSDHKLILLATNIRKHCDWKCAHQWRYYSCFVISILSLLVTMQNARVDSMWSTVNMHLYTAH